MTFETAASRPACRSPRAVPFFSSLVLAAACLAAGPALAQLAQGKSANAPIEITSDKLTVDQDKQIATFSGNVDGVQGDATLKADVMRVYYVQQDQAAGGAQGGNNSAASGGVAPSGNQNIKRIEADGSVVISQPDQTASGDHGIYNVPDGKVTLIGNVVITNKGNVVKGGKAVMDMNTNISTVFPDDTGKVPAKSQRVRALFQNSGSGGAKAGQGTE